MSLVPARHNFTIYQGATFYKRIFYQVEGLPVDLSNSEAWLVLKNEPSGTKLFEITSKGEGITLGGITGTIDIRINAVDTSTFTWTSAVYEFFVRDIGVNRTDVILRGGFKVVAF